MGEHRPGLTRPKMARCAVPDCGHAGHRHDNSGACMVWIEPLLPGEPRKLCDCIGFEAGDGETNAPLARHAAKQEGPRPYFEEWNRLADLLHLPRTTNPHALVTAVADALFDDQHDRPEPATLTLKGTYDASPAEMAALMGVPESMLTGEEGDHAEA